MDFNEQYTEKLKQIKKQKKISSYTKTLDNLEKQIASLKAQLKKAENKYSKVKQELKAIL